MGSEKPKYCRVTFQDPDIKDVLTGSFPPPDEDYVYWGSSTLRDVTEVTFILKSAIPPPKPHVPVEILRFALREDMQKDPRVPPELRDKWERSGPVYKYGDKFYVQVYLGQHEWLIVNVDDPTEMHSDPGWDGTKYGWAVILGSFKVDWDAPPLADPPERLEGKPITGDALLFADPDKLREYLDETDPYYPKA